MRCIWAAALGALVCIAQSQDNAGLCAPGSASPQCDYVLATMATRPALVELELFLRTLRRFDARRAVYVASDTAVGHWLAENGRAYEPVSDVPCLTKYETYSRDWMKHKRWGGVRVWTRLQLEKTTVMAAALAAPAGVLFADAGLVWRAPLPRLGAGASRAVSSSRRQRPRRR